MATLGIASIVALSFIIVVFVLFLINFYRDPKRNIPKGNNIVSPADGKVINILKVNKNKIKIRKGFLGKVQTLTKDVAKECYVVSIFMSLFDVHINRAPLDGQVKSIIHKKGKFFAAFNFEKSLQNEKNEIIIKNKKLGKIKMIQIAGFLARRIICTLNKNQKVNKGQKIGKIVLGSQVTLILPAKKIKLGIKHKQNVKAGSTIIGKIK